MGSRHQIIVGLSQKRPFKLHRQDERGAQPVPPKSTFMRRHNSFLSVFCETPKQKSFFPCIKQENLCKFVVWQPLSIISHYKKTTTLFTQAEWSYCVSLLLRCLLVQSPTTTTFLKVFATTPVTITRSTNPLKVSQSRKKNLVHFPASPFRWRKLIAIFGKMRLSSKYFLLMVRPSPPCQIFLQTN